MYRHCPKASLKTKILTGCNHVNAPFEEIPVSKTKKCKYYQIILIKTKSNKKINKIKDSKAYIYGLKVLQVQGELKWAS